MGSLEVDLAENAYTEDLIQRPGTLLAFPLKCCPGAKYELSYDLGDGLHAGKADLVIKDRIAAEITDAPRPDLIANPIRALEADCAGRALP